jgi:hypothetical protein
MQTALSLAVAEEACEFEHRDLHWGNLLVRRDSNKTTSCRLRSVSQLLTASESLCLCLCVLCASLRGLRLPRNSQNVC